MSSTTSRTVAGRFHVQRRSMISASRSPSRRMGLTPFSPPNAQANTQGHSRRLVWSDFPGGGRSRARPRCKGSTVCAYDGAVMRPAQLAPRPQSVLRSCGLLMGVLLLGLLAMHGLGPVPQAETTHGHDRTVPTAGMDMGAAAAEPATCDHGGGDCQGHAKHADPTCASASVTGTPAVAPALL